MTTSDTVREVLAGDPGPDYWRRKREQGWQLAAVEWRRPPTKDDSPADGPPPHEVPYGLRVAADCRHLEPDTGEQRALTLLLALLIDDGLSLAQVAERMNGEGFRTRRGRPWTQKAVFELLPRVVEASPKILESAAWADHRPR